MNKFYAFFVILIVLFSITIAYSEENGYLVEDSILMKDVNGDKIFEPANMSGCHAFKGVKLVLLKRVIMGQ